MSSQQHYDAIVIGSGQAGGPLATALGAAGRQTALIERGDVGGTCINVGCTPTKTMVASARVAYLARRAADYGVRVGDVSVDLKRVRQRKRDIVKSFRSGSEQQIAEGENVELLRGEARFTGPKALAVNLGDGTERRLTADLIVIDTGGRPAMPDLPGLDRVKPLDSTSIMELAETPEHLIVLGGGYVGLEFAQMFRRFGSEVTVVQRGERLLNREDPDIAEAVADVLREDGIDVLLRAETISAEVGRQDGVRLRVKTPEGERSIDGSHLMAATGRQPNTDRLDAATGGVELDKRGYVKVDERLRTTAPDVFAVGDVIGGPAFTHISYDHFRILRENLIDGGDATTTGRLVPYVVYLDPQLGRVGLGEEEARRQGRTVKVASMPMSSVARALETDETRGLMKAVVDAETDQVLGCAIFGIEGGEIMSLLEVAMMGGVTATALRDGIFAHPTIAESLNNLFASFRE